MHGDRIDPERPVVDAVYTWVDGEDELFHQLLERHIDEAQAVGVDEFASTRNRFRDNNCLAYSIASLLAFAPFIRNIYVVTNGQTPRTGRSDPRIRTVTHEQIFKLPAALPTFNSRAIALNVHRIDGLSEHFLFLNDDLFLGRPAYIEDFCGTNGQPKLRFSEEYANTDPSNPASTSRAMAHCNALLDRRFGRREKRHKPPHAPLLMSRSKMRLIESFWRDEIDATIRARFRTDQCYVPPFMYLNSLAELDARMPGAESHEIEILGKSDYIYVPYGTLKADLGDALQRVVALRPKYFCINDVAGEDGDWSRSDDDRARTVLESFFAAYYGG